MAERTSQDVEVLRSRYETRLEELDALRREMRRQLAEELDRRVQEKVEELNVIIENLKGQPYNSREVQEGRQEFKERVKEIEQEVEELLPEVPDDEPDRPFTGKAGEAVRIASLGLEGELLNNPGSGDAVVAEFPKGAHASLGLAFDAVDLEHADDQLAGLPGFARRFTRVGLGQRAGSRDTLLDFGLGQSAQSDHCLAVPMRGPSAQRIAGLLILFLGAIPPGVADCRLFFRGRGALKIFRGGVLQQGIVALGEHGVGFFPVSLHRGCILSHGQICLGIGGVALNFEGGETFVNVKQGDRFVKRPVKLGLETETEAVVLNGLPVGAEVKLNSSY
jgi:hypothetical protein